MCSFYFYDVYDRHKKNLNFTQKLHPFSGIYFCTSIMMEMVREDILTNLFGNIWSRLTNTIADTSTKRASQSK